MVVCKQGMQEVFRWQSRGIYKLYIQVAPYHMAPTCMAHMGDAVLGPCVRALRLSNSDPDLAHQNQMISS